MNTHCDDLTYDPAMPAPLREFLEFHRQPAINKRGDGPPLFATFACETEALMIRPCRPESFAAPECEEEPLIKFAAGQRVRIVMASRFGDVGVTTKLDAVRGYEARVYLPCLTDFSATVETGK
jgi:hypothetical protein